MIVGDFDADGATSTALSVLALRQLGFSDVDYLVPNRFEQGYGLSIPVAEMAIEKGVQLLMTVDNGVSSFEGIAFFERKRCPCFSDRSSFTARNFAASRCHC